MIDTSIFERIRELRVEMSDTEERLLHLRADMNNAVAEAREAFPLTGDKDLCPVCGRLVVVDATLGTFLQHNRCRGFGLKPGDTVDGGL